MDAKTSPQHPAVGEGGQNNSGIQHKLGLKQSYGSLFNRQNAVESFQKLDLCPISTEQVIPTVEFIVDEVNSFTREEGLHQAVIIKFSYGKPDLQELRRIFPKLFDVKGNCNIGQLEYRHILVRFDLFEDFANVISKTSGYVKSKGDEFFFRTFPWTMGFNPREETSIAVTWISFPELPANFFAKKSLLSIAFIAGKPIAIDKATQDRTRPSTARVKILVNLLDKHPMKAKIKIVDKTTGKNIEYEQRIVFDNLPKYCTCCNHQGHDVNSCRWNSDELNEHLGKSADQSTVDKIRGDAREFLNANIASRRIAGTVPQKPALSALTVSELQNPEANKTVADPVVKIVQQNSEPMIGLTAVTDKGNLAILKAAETSKVSVVSQAADSVRAMKEVLDSHSISIVNENPAVNVESAASVLMSKYHATSGIHPGHLNDHFGQSDNMLSKLKDTVPLDKTSEEEKITCHPAVIENAVIENMNAAKSSNAAVVPQAADPERALKEVLDSHPISTVSEKPSANVESTESALVNTDHVISSVQTGMLIGHSGNSDKMLSKVIATVPLDITVEEEKITSQHMRNTDHTGNNTDHIVLTVQPKQKSTVSTTKDNPHKTGQRLYRAVTQLTSSFHDLRYTVEQQPDSPKHSNVNSCTHKTTVVSNETVSSRGLEYTHYLGSDHYGNLIDHSGQSNQILSSLNSSVALEVIAEFDKQTGQELGHAGMNNIPAVNDNSEILVNKKDVAAVSQTADPERANQTNTVALDTIAEDNQSSSHHGKAVAINTEHTEVYLQPKSVSNTPVVPKKTGQQIYDQLISENAPKQKKTRHPKEDTDQNASSQQNKNKFQQRAAEQEAKHVGKAAGRGIQKVRRYPPISTSSIYSGEEIFPIETVKQSTMTKLQHTAANKAGNNTVSNNLVKEYG